MLLLLVAVRRDDGCARLNVDQWCCLRFRPSSATRSTLSARLCRSPDRTGLNGMQLQPRLQPVDPEPWCRLMTESYEIQCVRYNNMRSVPTDPFSSKTDA
jgi:hypothetical protein